MSFEVLVFRMSLVVFKWIAPLGVVGRAPRCRWSRLWVNPITPQPPYQPSGWSYRYIPTSSVKHFRAPKVVRNYFFEFVKVSVWEIKIRVLIFLVHQFPSISSDFHRLPSIVIDVH